MTQNQIAYKNAVEQARHNKAQEEETNRHQRMAEALENYSITAQRYATAINNLHYLRMDAETARANRAREDYNIAALSETGRSNRANETLKDVANRINAAAVQETSRHQAAVEAENARHNVVSEVQQRYKNAYEYVDTMYNVGLTSAKTKTQHAQTGLVRAQTSQSQSQTTLNYELAETQSSERFKNYALGVKSYGDTFTGLLKVITPVEASGSEAAQSWKIWNAFNAQLQ